MPSNAMSVHLRLLLRDAIELNEAHRELRTGNPGRQYGLASLNRAMVVTCVSAWESYVEELMREALVALRPSPPLGVWSVLDAFVQNLLSRFNTPNAGNVMNLIQQCIGVPDVRRAWGWQNCTPAQAAQRLETALTYRHQIAHGVNPRPIIHNFYSSQLPEFIRRLSRCTDAAVRNHLVIAHGIVSPWPA